VPQMDIEWAVPDARTGEELGEVCKTAFGVGHHRTGRDGLTPQEDPQLLSASPHPGINAKAQPAAQIRLALKALTLATLHNNLLSVIHRCGGDAAMPHPVTNIQHRSGHRVLWQSRSFCDAATAVTAGAAARDERGKTEHDITHHPASSCRVGD